MSTHNIFSSRNKNIITTLRLYKNILSGAMMNYYYGDKMFIFSCFFTKVYVLRYENHLTKR